MNAQALSSIERAQRAKTVANQIAKLRRRASDMEQYDMFNNVVQDEMFGGSLPEIRQRVNALLEELEELQS